MRESRKKIYLASFSERQRENNFILNQFSEEQTILFRAIFPKNTRTFYFIQILQRKREQNFILDKFSRENEGTNFFWAIFLEKTRKKFI